MRSRAPMLAAMLLCAPLALTARAQDVAVETYTLPSGMTVILHEDHSLPVATVNIWYRVGSQDEPPGRSGFAHLFEHLMFMGTTRVPGNQFDVIMETGGGSNNASTDLFRTNYFSSGPSSLLPTLLWLDADRLEDMGNTMTQEKLDKQRDVVRNELRQTVENAPYGKANEMVYKLMFPPTHPYYYGVIGTHADLEAANVTNVKDFFATFYVPSNASLVVAGDFDPKAIKPVIDGLFGTLSPGAPVTRKYERPTDPIPNRLGGERRYTTIDQVQLPRVEFSYHSPVAYGPGDADMELAGAVLASGNSSRLYKRLVIDDKLASEVDAAQYGYPLGGMFQVSVLAAPEADLDAVERAIDEELARLVKDGPTADELERYKASIELRFLQSLQSISRKADRLNEYQYYWGEPNSFKRDLDRYRNATPASVKEWCARTLTPNARVAIRVLPEEPTRTASMRDQAPADTGAAPFAPPAPVGFSLQNGLKVLLWQRSDLPLVSLDLLCRPSGAVDPADRPGLASIAMRMLSEGAGPRDSLAFSDALQSIGASFHAAAGHESADVSMTVLKRNIDAGIGLFADAVRAPRFDQDDWDRIKRLTIDELNQLQDNPRALAAIVASRLLYADANPYARPTVGTLASVESISRDEARSAYQALMDPAACTLLVAGDLSQAEAAGLLDKAFGSWSGTSRTPARPSDFSIPRTSAMRVAIVDRPNATQTVVYFAAPGVPFADPSRVRLRLLNTILGGSFTSRLNQNLREDKGYTYGARSRWAMEPSTGAFTASASVQAQVTGASLKEFFGEFDRLKAGDITEEEARKARETLRNDMVTDFEGLSGLLGAASSYLSGKEALASIGADMASIERVTASDLNSLARSAVALDRGVLVLVGDRRLILDQIKDLGLPTPIDVTPAGDPDSAQ